MFDYILADEDNHIGLSSWIRVVAGKDQNRLEELARYQTIKEQEHSDYSDWLISKRRKGWIIGPGFARFLAN